MPHARSHDGSTTVLIAGAGPTGLTLACELARKGVAFRLIEAAPGPQAGSRGKGLQPRTLEVFDDLGLVDRIIANGRMPMPMLSIAPDGTSTVTGTDTLGVRPDVPYPTTLLLPQWRVEEALRRRLAEFDGTVEFGTTFRGFTQSEAAVSAVLGRGSATETVTADWLVGCDGGHSAVRKQAGIAFAGETRDEVRMIIADLKVDGLDRDFWVAWRTTEGLVSLCPLPSTDAFQYQASIAPAEDSAPTLGNMQAILERRSGRTDIRLREPAWVSLWRANIRLADRFRQGRVFIAGDAAHVHSPAGGQGMNTGIQDAHNLGWKLAAVVKGAPVALLDTYEAERRPVAAAVLALSNARLKQAIETRDIPTRRDATTMQLSINYRGSVLAQDGRDETAVLRAGDRAPDATGLLTPQGECRLFDLTRGGVFTLLDFGGASASGRLPPDLRIFHVVDQPVDAGDIADPAGQLAATYGTSGRTLVLIRPDGYVGLISDTGDIAAVSDYLAAMR